MSAGADADDALLAGVLEASLARIEAGEGIDIEALAAAHPSIAGRLRQCLATLQFVEQAAHPLCAPGGGVPEGSSYIGEFRILREIGRGGMGVVYEAEQALLRRRVALKVLPFAAVIDPRQVQRFKNESYAAAQLHHPNIVPVFAVGQDRGIHYYAMQRIEGQSLAELIAELRGRAGGSAGGTASAALSATGLAARHRAYFEAVAHLGAQAADALAHAHDTGVVHRDIKPSNLLVDGSGRLWVSDFGLARVQGEATLTLTGDIVGTLAYMSPEQALARDDDIDHRTDIYSLGATLHELSTLSRLFPGSSREELLRQITWEEPAPARRATPDMPVDLETILLKATAKRPQDRYATAAALAADLRHFLAGEAILARRPTAVQRLARWSRRRRAALAIVVALVVAMASIGLLAAKQSADARRDREARYEAIVLDQALQVELAMEQSKFHTLLEQAPEFPDWNESRDALLRGAVSELAAAARLAPARPEAPYHEARALLALGRREEGLRATASALAIDARFVPAAALCDSLASEGTDGASGMAGAATGWASAWLRARRAQDRGLWLEAAAAYGEAIENLDGKDEPFLGLRLEATLARGRALLRVKDLDGALVELGAAHRLWPGLTGPALLLGKVFCEKGAIERAEPIFEGAFAREQQRGRPGRLDATAIAVAAILNQAGAPEKALAWAERAATSTLREIERSSSFAALKRPTDRIAALRTAVQLGPDSLLGRYNLARALYQTGDFAGAATEYTAAVRLDPREGLLHTHLGWSLLHAGRAAEAFDAFERAMTLQPNGAGAFSALERLLRRPDRGDLGERRQRLAAALITRIAAGPEASGLPELAMTLALDLARNPVSGSTSLARALALASARGERRNLPEVMAALAEVERLEGAREAPAPGTAGDR